VRGSLEAESGLNDAPTLLLVTLVSTGEAAENPWYLVLGIVVVELIFGGVIGVALGFLGARMLAGAALPASGL
jgi:cell volume regulation protein A